jgi:hypothetical protein
MVLFQSAVSLFTIPYSLQGSKSFSFADDGEAHLLDRLSVSEVAAHLWDLLCWLCSLVESLPRAPIVSDSRLIIAFEVWIRVVVDQDERTTSRKTCLAHCHMPGDITSPSPQEGQLKFEVSGTIQGIPLGSSSGKGCSTLGLALPGTIAL